MTCPSLGLLIKGAIKVNGFIDGFAQGLDVTIKTGSELDASGGIGHGASAEERHRGSL